MATEYRQRPGMGDHFDDEDLVMSSAQQRRNWRGILIALMVIVAVLAMIVTSVVLLTPPQPEELSDSYSDLENGNRDGSDYYYNQRANDELWWRRRGMRTLRLSDLLSDSSSIKTFNGTWISGNEVFYVTGSGDLAIMEITTDATIQFTRHLMSKIMLQKIKGPLVSFELSPDRNHVLIGHDAKKLFRYSKTARYTVYTVSTGQMTPIMFDDHQRWNKTTSDIQPYLLHAQWHTISTTNDKKVKSMALIVVYRYDIFYVPWSIKSSGTVTYTGTGKNDTTVDVRPFNTTNSQTSTSTFPDKGVNGDNNSTSSELKKPWSYGPVRRITTSGSGAPALSAGVVSNGVADYLYEMEILKRSPAVWPTSGRYLMYATFDDRRVGDYKYSAYMKDERQRNNEDNDAETENYVQQQKQQRKKKRRRRRIRRNAKPEGTLNVKANDESNSEYYLYPEIRTIKYPKANTPNPVVTLSVIVNLDQLVNPQVQPKIRILTPPPIFQYTDDYYFTAVQWVNDGRVSDVGGSHEVDDDKLAGASAAEVCVVWLNRAQNTSVTTLCKSPMWMCQVTQVINAVGTGGGADSGSSVEGGPRSDAFGSAHARRRYRRNGGGTQNSPPGATGGEAAGNNGTSSASDRDDRDDRHRRRQQPRPRGQRPHNGLHSRRRRAGEAGVDGGNRDGTAKERYGGWVDAAVGGAGGGVPSTGGGVGDGGYAAAATTWWSGADDGENFAGDDGYAGVAGVGAAATSAAGYAAAVLVRRGWETGDKELTPRVPVFAADGQGYVSIAPVRDDGRDDDAEDRDGGEGGVRLRRPSSPKQHSHDRNGGKGRSSSVGKYYAQVVAVNITKKLLAPLTFGEQGDDGAEAGDKRKRNAVTKSWTVVRILAWDQHTDMIYFLAIPSGRGAPHHRHLYAIKFTSPTPLSAPNTDSSNRPGHHYQQQYRKNVRHNTRNRPMCLSCDMGTVGNTSKRKRRDVGGKQNRMDEARDDRLRQQQRERWEHQKEEEEDDEEEAATAEEAERRQQRNRRQQQREMHGTRHCTYYDAVFSRDGSHYALVCLGPSVPFVTLHRIVTDYNDDDEGDDVGSGDDDVDSTPNIAQKQLKNSSYSFEFIALVENNTRLQDKYTNRVLLPGTRTFQLRLSGGRKLTTAGGLHFNDPLAAADYYSNGGGQQLHFSTRKRQDSDPLTVAQVRLYLPVSVYDPEADPRPEFMSNHVSNTGDSTSKVDINMNKATSGISTSTHGHRRLRRSSSSSSSSHDTIDDINGGSKRQRRPHKQQRQRRYTKFYPMLVIVNSDPGSQAITDRFADRLGYTTGLLCSGSLDKTLSGGGGGGAGTKYSNNYRNHQRQNKRRNRRSTATRYYSSSHLDDDDDNAYDYDQYDGYDINNNEYVIAVIDPGRGTWARGYESLLALNYGDGNDGYGDKSNGENIGPGGLLGTADIRDQMEAVEYLLSSATTSGDSYKDDGQGYYSEDRPRGGRGSRDRSRWFSSTSQTSNRRYYNDDDDNSDYYNDNEEYDDKHNTKDNEDYYYYYYSNNGDNSDYGDEHRGDDFHRDGDEKRNRRDRRSASDTKANFETLRLPYVDASRVALLGGGPTSPSTPSSIYGGYVAARMSLWQSLYGGTPIERRNSEERNNENRKEPVAIHSSFKCAISMAPVFSWRLYASAFAERYYGYYGGNDGDNWMSYDRSDLIPFTGQLNDSSLFPSSNGKGINLLVMHGTADTTIHPQNSMMLVRKIMQQQQQHQQYIPSGIGRYNSSTAFGGRFSNRFPTRTGAIRISQLVLPDVDLSNSRMATGMENGSPISHQHQLLHSIYAHVTQYLNTECFTGVGDGSRGRGIRVRGQHLRKRRRRRWRAGNREQENLDHQQQQLRGGEVHRQQNQQNQRIINEDDKDNPSTSNNRNGSGDRSNNGRFRRNDIDSSHQTLEGKVKDDTVVIKIHTNIHGFDYSNNSINSWGNTITDNLSNINSNESIKINRNKRKRDGHYNEEENGDGENSNEEYDNDEKDEVDIDYEERG